MQSNTINFTEENIVGNTDVHTKLPEYFVEENSVSSELCVKLPEYFTDNVRQHTVQKQIEETDLDKEIRQSKDAARAAARRKKETSPEKRRRLAQSAAHIAMKRKMETPEQREMRLAKDAARTAERRRRETFSERETRLAIDAARHASKRRQQEDRGNAAKGDMHSDANNNNPSLRGTYGPSNPGHQNYYLEVMPHDRHNTTPLPPAVPSSPDVNEQQARPHGAPSMPYESKYGNLLSVIEDLGREIRPTYAGSKMSQDRLRKGIMHARELVRGCLAEVEKKMR